MQKKNDHWLEQMVRIPVPVLQKAKPKTYALSVFPLVLKLVVSILDLKYLIFLLLL